MAEPFLPGWADAVARIPEKDAYLEAAQKCPNLVQAESNPDWFVSVEGNDVDAAAARLCLYWKERKAAFGDKAFLPLKTSGECALWEDDIELLDTKAYAMLPPDARGRPVLCVDLSRSEKNQKEGSSSALAEMRLAFYWALKLVAMPVVVSEGVHLIKVTRSLTLGQIKGNLATIERAMPFRIHRFHLCANVSARERKYLVRASLPLIMKEFNKLFPGRAYIQMAPGMLQKLAAHDLRSQGLPLSLGGIWSYEQSSNDSPAVSSEALRAASLPKVDVRHVASKPPTVEAAAPSTSKPMLGMGKTTGLGEPMIKTSELVDRSMLELRKAITVMNDMDKAAYLEAVETAPNVVQAESDPVWFLRSVSFDAERAAFRLCRYWKQRKKSFGDRAFRSVLDLSGAGALDEEDVAAMKTGFCVRLPHDIKGREVVLTDMTRANKSFSFSKSGIRVWFCIVAQCARNPLTQTEGVVGLRFETNTNFHPDLVKRELRKIRATFPDLFYHYHVCYSALPGAATRVGLPILIRTLVDVMPGRSTAQSWTSRTNSFEGLKEHGISGVCLPPSLGGSWSYEDNEPSRKASEVPKEDVIAPTTIADATIKSRKATTLDISDDVMPLRKRHRGDNHQVSPVSTSFDGVAIESPATASTQVDSVLQAIRVATKSTGQTVREVLMKAAAKRAALRETQRTTLPSEVSVTAGDQARLRKLAQKETMKRRLLQKLLAGKGYDSSSRIMPTQSIQVVQIPDPSSVRSLLIAKIVSRMRSLPSNRQSRTQEYGDGEPVLLESRSKPSMLLKALDAIRQKKEVSLSDLLAKPAVSLKLMALLNKSRTAMTPALPPSIAPMKMASKPPGSAQPRSDSSTSSVAMNLPSQELAENDQRKKSKVKKLLLERVLDRLKVGSTSKNRHHSAMRSALTSKLLDKLMEKRGREQPRL